MSKSAVIRAFIAVELPHALRDQLAAVLARLRQAAPPRAARWVPPENIHLTLKFLGDVPVAQLDEVQAMMRAAAGASAPFVCAASGLGCFPSCQRPRVLWAGVQDSGGSLQALQTSLEEGAARLGFPRERAGRGFNPHLTLGRAARDVRGPDARRLGEAVRAQGAVELGPLPVEALALMRSDLRPGGSVYTRIGLARLGEPAQISSE